MGSNLVPQKAGHIWLKKVLGINSGFSFKIIFVRNKLKKSLTVRLTFLLKNMR